MVKPNYHSKVSAVESFVVVLHDNLIPVAHSRSPSSPPLSSRPKSANKNNDSSLNRRRTPRPLRGSIFGLIGYSCAIPTPHGHNPIFPPHQLHTSRASPEYPNQCSLFINYGHRCCPAIANPRTQSPHHNSHTTSANHIPRNFPAIHWHVHSL